MINSSISPDADRHARMLKWVIVLGSVALTACAAAVVVTVWALTRPPKEAVSVADNKTIQPAAKTLESTPKTGIKPVSVTPPASTRSLIQGTASPTEAETEPLAQIPTPAKSAGFVQDPHSSLPNISRGAGSVPKSAASNVTPSPVPAPPPPVVPHGLIPVEPTVPPFGPDLDARIGVAIDKGMTFLLGQFNNGLLRNYNPKQPQTGGMDALAVYALLQAGEATHDERVGPNSPDVAKMLDALRAMDMEPNPGRNDSTYCEALRSAALSVYHRPDDHKALQHEVDWLVKDCRDGAFTYDPPNEVREVETAVRPRAGTAISASQTSARRNRGPWDNSNSQYGALGVWSASETQVGVEVPSTFWPEVHSHWVDCQLPDGEWGYSGYQEVGRLSMTVAGITTLFVAEDNMDIRSVATTLGRPPFSDPLQRGLNWLEAGDNAVNLPQSGWHSYNLYGLERAALASGFKYFGTHDWYRELAVQELARQNPNGAWSGDVVDTAYTLLFLSRGRHPVLMNKLRFSGYWANRPRDLSNLARFTSKEMERPINWQVVSLKADWSDWMDAPILYIASHEPPKFSDSDCQKLRNYALNGGLIFTHADGDSINFTGFVSNLSKRLFPEYKFGDISKDDPIYRTQYKLKPPPRLMGVSNGSRFLLVHSPIDLNKAWQLRDASSHPQQFQEGVDLFIYAAGKVNLKNKLKTSFVPEPRLNPIATTAVARIQYEGAWNPEPAAVPRFSRLFFSQTSIKVNVVDEDATQLNFSKTPMAFLTGTESATFTSAQADAVRKFVNDGGVLLIDTCGGSLPFNRSTMTDLIPHAFPSSSAAELPFAHPIRAGTGPGMTRLTMHLRSGRNELDGVGNRPLSYFTSGKGVVVLAPVDVTTGLLGTNTWPVNGYDPDTAYDIAKNVLLWTVERDPS